MTRKEAEMKMLLALEKAGSPNYAPKYFLVILEALELIKLDDSERERALDDGLPTADDVRGIMREPKP